MATWHNDFFSLQRLKGINQLPIACFIAAVVTGGHVLDKNNGVSFYCDLNSFFTQILRTKLNCLVSQHVMWLHTKDMFLPEG